MAGDSSPIGKSSSSTRPALSTSTSNTNKPNPTVADKHVHFDLFDDGVSDTQLFEAERKSPPCYERQNAINNDRDVECIDELIIAEKAKEAASAPAKGKRASNGNADKPAGTGGRKRNTASGNPKPAPSKQRTTIFLPIKQ